MARLTLKSIFDESMSEYKTTAFLIKRVGKKLDKEIDETTVRAHASRLVREGVIDHARAAKKYGIRGPRIDDIPASPKKATRKMKMEDSIRESSKKKLQKVMPISAKKSGKKGKNEKNVKTLRRSKS